MVRAAIVLPKLMNSIRPISNYGKTAKAINNMPLFHDCWMCKLSVYDVTGLG
jgi:hypothetical protein